MILVHAPPSFRRDFRHGELGVLQNCEPELPANGVHVSFLIDQLANLPPVPTLRALLAIAAIFAAFLDCTQRAAIFRRNGRGKLFAEILRTHRLEDRQMAKRCTSLGAGSRKPLFLVRISVVVESPWRRSRDNTQGLSAAARLSPIPAGADLRILCADAADCVFTATGPKRLRGYRQSSSASRFTAGAAGFLLLIQCCERPEM